MPQSTTNRCARRSPRRGSMLLEAVVSAALLGTLFVTIGQVVVLLQRQTELADRHYVAQQTLENLLEEFTHRPWSEITSARIEQLELPPWVVSKLPRALLQGEVTEEAEPVAAKRITLRLGWRNGPAGASRPLILTTWIYPSPQEQP
jgi:hypothetical protein